MGWSSTSQVTMIGTLLTLDGHLFSGIFSLVTCYLSHSGIFLFAGQSLWGEGRGAARCASVSTQYTSAEVYSQISCTTSIPASSWNIEQKGSDVENVGWPHSSAWTLLAPQQFRVYADCAVSAVPADCKYRKTQTFCKIINQVQILKNRQLFQARVPYILTIHFYRRAIWAKKMDRRVSIFKQNKHAGKLNIVMTFLVIIYRYRRFQKRIQISENKIQTNKNAQACGSCDGCFSVPAEDDWYTTKIP